MCRKKPKDLLVMAREVSLGCPLVWVFVCKGKVNANGNKLLSNYAFASVVSYFFGIFIQSFALRLTISKVASIPPAREKSQNLCA